MGGTTTINISMTELYNSLLGEKDDHTYQRERNRAERRKTNGSWAFHRLSFLVLVPS